MSRERAHAVVNLFVLSDRAVIPTSVKTASGYTISIEPVEVFDYRDRNALKGALEQAVARGIRKVPDLPAKELIYDEDGIPGGLKEPIEPRYAGVADWDELERKSIYFFLQCYPSGFLLDSWGRSADGKWSDEKLLELRLPSDVGLELVIDAILDHLKNRPDLPGFTLGSSQEKTAKGV